METSFILYIQCKIHIKEDSRFWSQWLFFYCQRRTNLFPKWPGLMINGVRFRMPSTEWKHGTYTHPPSKKLRCCISTISANTRSRKWLTTESLNTEKSNYDYEWVIYGYSDIDYEKVPTVLNEVITNTTENLFLSWEEWDKILGEKYNLDFAAHSSHFLKRKIRGGSHAKFKMKNSPWHCRSYSYICK